MGPYPSPWNQVHVHTRTHAHWFSKIHFDLIFPYVSSSHKWCHIYISHWISSVYESGRSCGSSQNYLWHSKSLFQRVGSRAAGRNASITVILDGTSSVYSYGLSHGNGRQDSWEQWGRGLWGQDEGPGSEVSWNLCHAEPVCVLQNIYLDAVKWGVAVPKDDRSYSSWNSDFSSVTITDHKMLDSSAMFPLRHWTEVLKQQSSHSELLIICGYFSIVLKMLILLHK